MQMSQFEIANPFLVTNSSVLPILKLRNILFGDVVALLGGATLRLGGNQC